MLPNTEEAIPISINVRLKPPTINSGRQRESCSVPVTTMGTTGKTQGESTLVSPATNTRSKLITEKSIELDCLS